MDWFLQGEGCRWSGHHDEEEVKSIYIHEAIMDPGCLVWGPELSLAIGQQLNSSSKNWDIRCA